MSHQSASFFSVENVITVPWKFRRERRIESACSRRASRPSRPGTRCRIPIQSMSAEVGQRAGSIAIASSISGCRALVARERLDRRELADREVGGRQRRAARRRAGGEAVEAREHASSAPSPSSRPSASAICTRYAVSTSLPARSSLGK
jgi:hypothetical protein